MKKRILTAAIAIPIVLWLVIGSPFYVFGFACALAAAITAYEYFGFTGHRGLLVLLCLFLAVFTMSFGIHFGMAVWVASAFICVALGMMRADGIEGYLAATARYSFAFLYIGIGYSAIIVLREHGYEFLLAMMLSVWAADTFAYFGGKLLGRHPMSPKISPNKTLEGLAFGIAGATITYSVVMAFFPVAFLIHPAFIGLAVGAISVVGDLVESALKRSADVKDSGSILAGHGGMFDRMDSMIFTAPLYLILIILLMANVSQ
ncbi:phosphatidate cytidylyltransferase [Desulfurispirillum indicum]|uniref:Phosphatidate cytidylyltransferase n=1 Tax=Desulfurispirillum indicum (strain ATCC BAA-1389 / DSM 22839 / S5) TaxID=653733 RepID=E6W171_DESIS|nr:phosphatidate cytidylyltransferase [Desulfurispirillum indicum]ADU66491.1 phosphatidate cytidylyltransferase [Desulfurispirillum indicum S5]UCZ55827.1 phosphatidate cytidylyltransferase [Desulfurispirillum indicum]